MQLCRKLMLTTFLAEREYDYVLNAPHASHAGAVCEQQIRTEQNVFSSTLSFSRGRRNDPAGRSLTTDNLNDPNSLEPPSPNRLITMEVTKSVREVMKQGSKHGHWLCSC